MNILIDEEGLLNPNLYSWIADSAKVPVLLVLIIFSIILMVALGSIDRPLRNDLAPKGIISFELAGSRAKKIVNSWSQAARQNAFLSLGLDYLYLSVYPLALSLACQLAAATVRGLWLSIGGLISWLVLAAMPLDAFEDYALIKVLKVPESERWPEVAKWCAIPKFGLVFLGLIYLLLWLGLKIAERVM